MADLKAAQPIESKESLVEYLEEGCKPSDQFKIGTEHEKFGYRLDDLRPLEYGGDRGIKALLDRMHELFGWEPILEGGNIIGLKHAGGASVTLEPGGQFELSGAPLDNVHETCKEVHDHLKQVKKVSDELGIGFAGLGFQPKWGLDETPVMPKGRYGIMRRYMPTKGKHGLDMMFRSCTVQVNLDFASEADMIKKFRVSLALQPIATALFANSPFMDGKPSGYLSTRSMVWTDTDPDRTGMLPFVFEEGMGFERYVDYALDVPVYFVYRDGVYHDVAGQSFRAFMEGNLKGEGVQGVKATMADWEQHLTTLFPEVRIKKYMEMRGADSGPWGSLCNLPALWAGLLYCPTCLDAAWDLVKDWTAEERDHLRNEVPVKGLKTEFRGRTVRDIALEVLDLAETGLENRKRLNSTGADESGFLSELRETADRGTTPAEYLLHAYNSRWDGSIDPVFTERAF